MGALAGRSADALRAGGWTAARRFWSGVRVRVAGGNRLRAGARRVGTGLRDRGPRSDGGPGALSRGSQAVRDLPRRPSSIVAGDGEVRFRARGTDGRPHRVSEPVVPAAGRLPVLAGSATLIRPAGSLRPLFALA